MLASIAISSCIGAARADGRRPISSAATKPRVSTKLRMTMRRNLQKENYKHAENKKKTIKRFIPLYIEGRWVAQHKFIERMADIQVCWSWFAI